MAKLLVIILLASSNVAASQTQIRLLLNDLCKDSLITLEWEIVNSVGEIIKGDNEGNYLLQAGEEYFASAVYYRGQYMRLINFTFVVDQGATEKIVEVPKIAKFHSGNSIHFNEVFLNCNTLCSGKQVDFHSNNSPRLKGRFKEGVPRGRIEYYNTKGELALIEKYSCKGKLKKSIPKQDH